MRYVAFDVETPNNWSGRMSAIGVCVLEDGKIVQNLYTLVNPEVPFDQVNIHLTGIDESLVADSPKFPQVWSLLEPVFSRGILLAHNAPFDLSVLSRCLEGYGLRWRGRAPYADTVRLAKKAYPELRNHRLDTLCQTVRVDLNHHNAGSDATACARLFLDFVSHGVHPEEFYRTYDMIFRRTVPFRNGDVL